jgi:hypothetical protein
MDAKRAAMRQVIEATLKIAGEREAQLDVIEQRILNGQNDEAIALMRVYLNMKKPPQRSESYALHTETSAGSLQG